MAKVRDVPIYTVVIHRVRKQLGISVEEYCVADSIHKLSRPVCKAGAESIAQHLELNIRSVRRYLKHLQEADIVKQVTDEFGQWVGWETTDKWYTTAVVARDLYDFGGSDKMAGGSDKMAPRGDKVPEKGTKWQEGDDKVSPNNNNYTHKDKHNYNFLFQKLQAEFFDSHFPKRTMTKEEQEWTLEKLKAGESITIKDIKRAFNKSKRGQEHDPPAEGGFYPD